jgi:hypothetical protein
MRKSPAHLKSGTSEYARWWKENNRERHLEHKRLAAKRKAAARRASSGFVDRQRVADHRKELVRAAHARGLSFPAIVIETGLTLSAVSNIASRLGLRGHGRSRMRMTRIISAKRLLAMAMATPKWVDQQAILAVYRECEIRRDLCAEDVNVDHVVPINHPKVCGLHVPWNLQVIPAAENRRKSNRFEV